MAIEEKPYVGDVGTVIEAEAEKDLTSNDVLRLEMTKPDGTTQNWACTIKSGDDSVAEHTIIADDFDQAGHYRGQIYAHWSNNDEWHGETFCFEVFALNE